jgi:CHAT domain-containing protein
MNGLSKRRSNTTGEDLSSVYFAPLAGTAEEARTIQSLFPESEVLTGSEATKSALKRVDAPSILHIATHGFYLANAPSHAARPAIPPAGSGTRSIGANVRIENPLLRSGLALAGANLRWEGSDDGILTAMEASYLNLWGTTKGLGRGESLRQTQLSMLKRKERQHPFYWASFIQSGDWRSLDGK